MHAHPAQPPPSSPAAPEGGGALRAAWERCAALGLSRDLDGPRRVLADDDVGARRGDSPLARHVDVAADVLGLAGGGAEDRLAVVAGPDGTVLWRRGGRAALRRADRLGFVEGAGWDEDGVGTNAIGQALLSGRPEELRGSEHFARSHAAWDCTSAPVRHPATGAVVGVLDLSGPRESATADTRHLVRSATRVLEALLGGPDGTPAAPAGPRLELRLLAEPAMARVDGGAWFELTLRTAEILALLCLRERGWSAEELAYAVYGDDGTPGTIRTEMHRLRRRLGPVVATRPYRFAEPGRVASDVVQLQDALEAADAERALCLYRQPLLRSSALLAVEEWRAELDRVTTDAVRRSGDARLRVRWEHTEMGRPVGLP